MEGEASEREASVLLAQEEGYGDIRVCIWNGIISYA